MRFLLDEMQESQIKHTSQKGLNTPGMMCKPTKHTSCKSIKHTRLIKHTMCKLIKHTRPPIKHTTTTQLNTPGQDQIKHTKKQN